MSEELKEGLEAIAESLTEAVDGIKTLIEDIEGEEPAPDTEEEVEVDQDLYDLVDEEDALAIALVRSGYDEVGDLEGVDADDLIEELEEHNYEMDEDDAQDLIDKATSYYESEEEEDEDEDEGTALTDVDGVTEAIAEELKKININSAEDLAEASPNAVAKAKRVSKSKGKRLIASAKKLQAEPEDDDDDNDEEPDIESDAEDIADDIVKGDLRRLTGVRKKLEDAMKEAGFESLEDIAKAKVKDLQKVPGIGKKTAKDYKAQAKTLLAEIEEGNGEFDEEDEEDDLADVKLTAKDKRLAKKHGISHKVMKLAKKISETNKIPIKDAIESLQGEDE